MEIGVSGANVKILSLHRLQAGLGSRRPISSPGRDGCSSPGGAATRDRGSGRRRAAARFRHRFCPQISRLCAVSGGRGPPICLQIKDRVIGSQRLPLYGALCCQWKKESVKALLWMWASKRSASAHFSCATTGRALRVESQSCSSGCAACLLPRPR